MSKTISDELKAHLAGSVTTIATCWAVCRRDGRSFFFTDHDVDIEYGGYTYKSSVGMVGTAISADRSLSTDNMEAYTVLKDESITVEDIEGGLFDDAVFDVFILNYMDTSMGVLNLAMGWTLGNVTVFDSGLRAEIRSVAQKLNKHIIEASSLTCRATVGDARCGLDFENQYWYDAYVVSGFILTDPDTGQQYVDRKRFIGYLPVAVHGRYFNRGKIEFTGAGESGETDPNDGIEVEVLRMENHPLDPEDPDAESQEFTIELMNPIANEFMEGSTFRIWYGCDKTRGICKTTFSNVQNFQGEPDLPMFDDVVQGQAMFKVFGNPL